MKMKAWWANVYLWLAIMASGLVCNGCTTSRFNSSLYLSGDPIAGEVQYNIVEVSLGEGFSPRLSRFAEPDEDPGNLESIRENLMVVAMAAYPLTFSVTSNAVPLRVRITRGDTKIKDGVGRICLCCLSLSIVPGHEAIEVTYCVQTWSGRDLVDQRLAEPSSFKITKEIQRAILPTAYITIFMKEGETVYNDEVLESRTNLAQKKEHDLLLESCVEAIAIKLRRIKPEAWGQ